MKDILNEPFRSGTRVLKIKAHQTMSNITDPLPYRRNYGLFFWSYNYDGVTPYCFMQHDGGVWNDLDGEWHDFNIAFPTVNGAVGTLALEAMREGADDVRYATLLLRRIENARQNGTPES